MSDVTAGIIRMPLDIALGDDLARAQYHATANAVLNRLCSVEKERDSMLAALQLAFRTPLDSWYTNNVYQTVFACISKYEGENSASEADNQNQ